MYLHDLLMRARQDELLQAAAQHRLAADARREQPSVAVRLPRRAGSHWLRLLTAWAGGRPTVTSSCGASTDGGAL